MTDDYIKHIKKLSKKSSNHVIQNRSISHATEILNLMLKKTQRDIRIFTGSLEPSLYDSLSKELAKALNRGVKLSIILSETDSGTICKRDSMKHITEHANTSLNTISTLDKINTHFIVSDEKGYRMESENGNIAGVANFNDIKTAKMLASRFDEISKKYCF